MKILMILPFAMAFSATVFAQDVNPSVPKEFKPVTVNKIKITCSDDRIEKVSYKGEEPQEQVTKGKTSESIRTTWASGDTEYRFSEFTSFFNDGKEVRSNGKAMTKVVTKVEGNQVTETSQVRQVINYVRKDIEVSGGNLQQRDFESIAVYQVNGSERTLILAVDNGKISPTHGQKEVEIKLNDKQKVVQITEKTPYTIDDGDFKIEVLKAEMNCMYETVN